MKLHITLDPLLMVKMQKKKRTPKDERMDSTYEEVTVHSGEKTIW
jgi:hypothetical protein